MKSLKYFTDKQRAILAGDPRPNPVSTSADPLVEAVGDRVLVDSEEDDVVAQKVRQAGQEEGVLEHTGLRHPLEVLVRCLSPSTDVRILICSKPFRIQVPRFPLRPEKLYHL